jgi:WD40 repeat protein
LPWKKQPEIDLEAVDEKFKGLTPAPNVELSPSPIETLEGYHLQEFDLEVTRKLPWLGWSRREALEAHLTILEGDRPIPQDIQRLELGILPVIPFWLQMTGGAFLLAMILLLMKLFPSGHTEPVNSVQFNGQGTEVLSGSNDQTIRRWSVDGDRLTSKGILLKEAKAIRTVRFRPVNNDEIAAGLENGEVRVANLLQRDDVRLGSLDNADRVFDLVFSRDSRQMYSAHGSGQVIPWTVDIRDGNGLAADQPIQPAQPFAISAIALLGKQEDLIAIGGRYNRLTVIDPVKKQSFEVPYEAGGQEDYIKSFALAQQQPDLLANSDNRGNIVLWDFSICRKNLKNCEPITRWTGHGGQSVNAVKMTNDGCFLASAGSDGQVKLWAMDGLGQRRGQNSEGKVLSKAKKPLNSVDIIRKQDYLLVATGGDDHRVNLQRVKLKRSDRRSANVCSNMEIN